MTAVWDLSDLYSGMADPEIKKDKKEIESLSHSFTKRYKGRINSKALTARFLLSALRELERLNERLYIYLNFASYLHSQDTESPKIGAFYQEAQEFSTKISSDLLWFSLEIQALSHKVAGKLITSPVLKAYKHYLKHLRVFEPFRKTLAEEQIIAKMNQAGSNAFIRFYDETFSSEIFTIAGKKIRYAELGSILKDHPSLEKRKAAASALTRTYSKNKKFYTYVLNTLLLDKKTSDEIRGYKYPQQSTFLDYEVDPKIVGVLVKSIEKNYLLSERYYITKSRILRRKLYEWDRYSRVYYKKPDRKISWEEARGIVLKSFREFDSEFSGIAQMFFDKGWIDAKVSSTKRSGAYCSYGVPSKHPYIFLSFTGTVDDVMTLAHELGHGIHAYLSRQNSLVNFYPSTATAEIASVFGESLVFDYLYKNTKDKSEKLNLLSNKIQGSFATIFRQTLFYLFEVDLHTQRREKGELSTEEISKLFQKRLQQMFGKGLTLTDSHKYWWISVLHFYHYNFYVFTYAFGEALTLALYEKYKLEGRDFVKKYKEALMAGGSLSPKQITETMGVDINRPGFWQKGIELLEEYVNEFESLAKKLS